MILNNNSTANKRDLIFSALKAEGVPALNAGYQNIHLNHIVYFSINMNHQLQV